MGKRREINAGSFLWSAGISSLSGGGHRCAISVEHSPKPGAPLEGLGREGDNALGLCVVVAAPSEAAEYDAHRGRAAED